MDVPATDKTLSAALNSGCKLELSVLKAGATLDVVERKSSTSVYKVVRLEEQQGGSRFQLQLHLTALMFHANKGNSDILRLARFNRAQGTIQLLSDSGLCSGVTLTWEGREQEGGVVAACRRFTFVYGGHEYAWDSHDKFSGTDLSCVSTTTGDTVAFYTSKMWPRKLQGELVVEAQVQSMNLVHILVAGCISYKNWLDARTWVVKGY